MQGPRERGVRPAEVRGVRAAGHTDPQWVGGDEAAAEVLEEGAGSRGACGQDGATKPAGESFLSRENGKSESGVSPRAQRRQESPEGTQPRGQAQRGSGQEQRAGLRELSGHVVVAARASL